VVRPSPRRDVAWCVGAAAAAYGLLAAERLGADAVVVFERDASRVPAVEEAFAAAGYGAVTVEPTSVLGWRRPGGRDDWTPLGGDDPVSRVVDRASTPGRPTVLSLDVPGYGSDFLSTVGFGDGLSPRSVLLKTTDTLASSELEAEGFETTVLATTADRSDGWRRAVLARRDPTTAGDDGAGSTTDDGRDADGPGSTTDDGRDSDGAGRRSRRGRDQRRGREVGAFAVSAVFSALGAFFEGVALLFGALRYVPGRHLVGRVFVGVVVAALFVAFLVLATAFVELGAVVGASARTSAAAAGLAVLAVPASIAGLFLYLAVDVRRDP